MALTQEQWFLKLQSFVPAWWFRETDYAKEVFESIAAMFAGLDMDADDQFLATFITEAGAPVIDLHGDERSIPRLTGEIDELYSPRVQQITSRSNKAAIKNQIDSMLLTGSCTILESPFDNPYLHRNAYCHRGNYFIDTKRDYFLVIVPPQVHSPYSFMARGYYNSRANFLGSSDSTTLVFQSIIAAINQLKAYGVMYGIVETP